MSRCKNCSVELSADEVGATKRFINRGATEFLCLNCLAKEMDVEKSLLEEKIEYLRRHGCSLFAKKE